MPSDVSSISLRFPKGIPSDFFLIFSDSREHTLRFFLQVLGLLWAALASLECCGVALACSGAALGCSEQLWRALKFKNNPAEGRVIKYFTSIAHLHKDNTTTQGYHKYMIKNNAAEGRVIK